MNLVAIRVGMKDPRLLAVPAGVDIQNEHGVWNRLWEKRHYAIEYATPKTKIPVAPPSFYDWLRAHGARPVACPTYYDITE